MEVYVAIDSREHNPAKPNFWKGDDEPKISALPKIQQKWRYGQK